jgi:hypothetical protein
LDNSLKTLLCLAFATLLCGCAVQNLAGPEERTVYAQWDSTAAQYIKQSGSNTLKGSGFMRQQGGGVVTCAGQTVTLLPATPYANERMTILFGPGQSGINRLRNIRFTPDPPEYKDLTRATKCDAQGNFLFEELADGDYFVAVTVQWSAGPYSLQGGNLMHRVRLSGGKQTSIVMSA